MSERESAEKMNKIKYAKVTVLWLLKRLYNAVKVGIKKQSTSKLTVLVMKEDLKFESSEKTSTRRNALINTEPMG